ncbi:MAG: SDR family NAD(P)-dependent oxidoreductase, partial [Chlamydiales bacterium]|nr:SDR family NAD(P)-dependent oxidoreductase [Chlamydiales bacterium]
GFQIKDIPDRSEYFRGQTPQSFSLPLIKSAHEKAILDGFVGTDDCSLIHRLKHPVYISYGSEENIKITTEIDLFIAEQLLRLKKRNHYSQHFSLHGKIFAITGGTGSIGCCIQKELEKEGAQVINISRSSTSFSADLSHPDAAKTIFERVYAEYGLLDGVINSMGQLVVKPLAEQTPIEIDGVIRSNLTSLIFSCKYAKVKEKGHILNIASSSYSRGRKDFVVYSSSKAAVVNFTQGLAEEYPHLFINALAPQRTLSEMRKKHFPNENTSTLLNPEHIAQEVVKILKSDQTGLIFDIKKI